MRHDPHPRHLFKLRLFEPRHILRTAAALAAASIVLGFVFSLVLSHLFAGRAAGWGDLIGAVVGQQLGVAAGFTLVFTVSALRAGRRWWVVVLLLLCAYLLSFLTLATLLSIGVSIKAVAMVLWVLATAASVAAGPKPAPPRSEKDRPVDR